MILNNNFEVVILSSDESKVTLLKHLLSNYYSMNIASVCSCEAEAIEYLNHHHPMIFFLDMVFSEVLLHVRKPPFTIGLCDAGYTKRVKHYLNMGFFDFFYKPYSDRELNRIMGKMLNIYGRYNKLDQRIIRQVEEDTMKYADDDSNITSMFLMGSRNEESIRIVFDKVLFMRKVGNHVGIFFEDGSSKLFRSNLKMFHTKFPKSKFQKINNSVVVNMDKVTGINKNRISVADNTNFEVSRSFKKPFMAVLNK